MSKYTTEVRNICERLVGTTEDITYIDVDELIKKAVPLLFTFDYPIFDDNYKALLEEKILRHYFTREIGLETFGLWKLKLETKLNEIMPYYNKLYSSELITINPLYTFHYSKSHKDSGGDTRNINKNDTKNTTKSGSDSRQTDRILNSTFTTDDNVTSNSNNLTNNVRTEALKDLYSDTPQGAITDLEDNNYLTNARINDNSVTDNGSSVINDVHTIKNNHTTGETDKTTDTTNYGGISDESLTSLVSDTIMTTREYIENVMGSEGRSESELLMEYRKTFLNIDMMVINELEPLFMQIW